MTKKRNTFSNFEPGYAEQQLLKLRNLKQQQQPDARLAALETFNDYQERQRVGGEIYNVETKTYSSTERLVK